MPPLLASSVPAQVIDGTVQPLARHIERRALRAYYGGAYVSGGRTVSLYTSDEYRPDSAWNQGMADWIVQAMLYGHELEAATFFFVTWDEMQTYCGIDALGCYNARTRVLYVPGSNHENGTQKETVLVHEYGHHVAAMRDNAPWVAFDTGPKRWATAADVCRRIAAGTASSNGDDYRRDPKRYSPKRTRN